MSTLKELRTRIKVVKSTQKITAAMKMVATAKLKRAQERAESGRPYADSFQTLLQRVLLMPHDDDVASPLYRNTESKMLILAIGTDRGLCGAYNTNIIREVKEVATTVMREGGSVLVAGIGRKIHDVLKREFVDSSISFSVPTVFEKSIPTLGHVEEIATEIMGWLDAGVMGRVCVVTGHLKSLISQPIRMSRLVPLLSDETTDTHNEMPYTLFEPRPEKLIPQMLVHNFMIQLNRLFAENSACEHAARMAAMDNASRNARDMIQKLQLRYNQGRQAQITNELIEIISGAEAA